MIRMGNKRREKHLIKKITLLFVTLTVLVACSPKQGVDDTKAYFNEAWEYVKDVRKYGENVTNIVKNSQEEGKKIEALKNESKKMRIRAEEFNAYPHPKSMKLLHRQLMNQNYLLIDSLDVLIKTIEVGNVSVEKISEMIEKTKINEIVQKLSSLIKKSE